MNMTYLIVVVSTLDDSIIKIEDGYFKLEDAEPALLQYNDANGNPDITFEIKCQQMNTLGRLVAKKEYMAFVELKTYTYNYSQHTTTLLLPPDCDCRITEHNNGVTIVSSYVSHDHLRELVRKIMVDHGYTGQMGKIKSTAAMTAA